MKAAGDQLQRLYALNQAARTSEFTAPEADQQNMAELAGIIDGCDWPARSRYGDRAALGAFVVLQHADLPNQLKYLPLVRKASRQNEVLVGTLPLLEDRVLIRQGRPQLYGSQVDPLSGWPLPVDDPENLDRRRLAAGMPWYADYWAVSRGIAAHDPRYVYFWWLLDGH